MSLFEIDMLLLVEISTEQRNVTFQYFMLIFKDLFCRKENVQNNEFQRFVNLIQVGGGR